MPRTRWVGSDLAEGVIGGGRILDPSPFIGAAQRDRVIAAIGDGQKLPNNNDGLLTFRAAVVDALGTLVALSRKEAELASMHPHQPSSGNVLLDLSLWAAPLLYHACAFAHALTFKAALNVLKVRSA